MERVVQLSPRLYDNQDAEEESEDYTFGSDTSDSIGFFKKSTPAKVASKAKATLPTEIPLADLFKTIMARVSKEGFDEVCKVRFRKKIKRAMDSGRSSCLMQIMVSIRDFTMTPIQKTDQTMNRKISSDEIYCPFGHIRLGPRFKELADWLLAEGLDWSVRAYYKKSEMHGGRTLSLSFDFMAIWYDDCIDDTIPHVRHPARNLRGNLFQYWLTTVICKTPSKGDVYHRWRRLCKNAMSCGSDRAILGLYWNNSDFFPVGNVRVFKEEFPQQIVPLGARLMPSNTLYKKHTRSGWAIDKHLKGNIQWLVENKMSWYLLFQSTISEEGDVVLSESAYLVGVFWNREII